jgi:hypothetical protein
MGKKMKNTSEDKDKIEQGKTELNLKANVLNTVSDGVHLIAKSVNTLNEYLVKQEESKKQEKKSNRSHSWKITITSLVVSLLGLSFTMYQFSIENTTKREFQHQQEVQAQIRQHIQSMETQIQDKISKRDNLNSAMSKTRNLLATSYLHCKNGKFSGNELKHGEKQLDYIYQMINSVYSIQQIFDPKIQNQANYFLKLLDDNRNACNQKKGFDMKLRLMQREINALMNNSIFLDKQKKEELLNKLANSPSQEE